MAQNFTVPVGLYTSATNPTVPTPATGDIYYNTSSSEMRVYDGSTWVAVGGGGAAAAGTLTGTTLASNVINSSLTSFGSSPTITTPALTLSTTTSNSTGRIAWDNTNSQIEIGNGSALKIFTADDAAATLTNKTISGSSNTVSTTGTLTIGTGLSGTSFNGSSNVTIAIDSTVATLTGTQTLTNKTLSSATLTGTLTAGGGAGTNGQFLQSTGTGVTWAAVSAAAATRSALGTVFGFTSNIDFATTGGQTYLGFQSGSSNAVGARGSTAIGYQAGNAWDTGELMHVCVGWRAGFADSGGLRNTVIGAAAMAVGTNNNDIVAVGYYAGYRAGLTLPGSTNCVFIGSQAGESAFGTSRFSDATIIGYQAARRWASGQWYFSNTIIGARACTGNGGGTTTASATTVIGADAWVNPDAGTTGNTVVGAFAMGASNTNKLTSFSTAVGYLAGWDSTTNGQTSIGYAAGYSVSGTENTFLGYRCGINLVTGSNNTLIGARANVSSFSVSNQITLGNSSITQLRCQVTTISGLSDARDKTNIIDIPIGLDFINAIRPVVFEWNHRPEYDDEGNEIPNAKRGTREGSFIAQELDAAQQEFDVEDWLAIVAKDNPDKLEAAPAKLIPVLVKAVQELSAKIEELEQRLGG
jgi:hypothetical protein